ncbi:hypothetical protein RHS01_05800 [Rhizoctonia solani]|uniref:Uncharacterized protein n=1 Tax=Rhizoctonia solani TaxID=456999 RepID=A0A8H7ID98_9AGAM|nr:hypothetical protein RHS01_05800 [Rhizoctonia solani]
MGRWSSDVHLRYWRNVGDIASKHADFIASRTSTPSPITTPGPAITTVPSLRASRPHTLSVNLYLTIRLHSAPGRRSLRHLDFLPRSCMPTPRTVTHSFNGGHAIGSEPPLRLGAPVFPTGVANMTSVVPPFVTYPPSPHSHLCNYFMERRHTDDHHQRQFAI